MKRLWCVLPVVAAVVASASVSNAGVLLEPYVGYQSIAAKVQFGSGVPALDGQSMVVGGTGPGFGLRLGFSLPMVFVAADYMQSNQEGKVQEQPSGATITAGKRTESQLGATVGLNLPMLRPYVGYIFDDQSKGDTSTWFGNGFKVGVGFKFLPKIAINLEYQSVAFTKEKDTAGTETTYSSSTTFKSITSSGFMLGVSLPLDF